MQAPLRRKRERVAPRGAARPERLADVDFHRRAPGQPGPGAQHRARAAQRYRDHLAPALRGGDERAHVEGTQARLAREGALGINDERFAGARRGGELARAFDRLARGKALDEARAEAREQPAEERHRGQLALGDEVRSRGQRRREDQAVDAARVVGDEDHRRGAALRPDPVFEHLEVGWGDRAYYMAPEGSLWLGARALLWPTPGVLHVAAFNGPPERYFAEAAVVELAIAAARPRSACAALRVSHSRSAASRGRSARAR